MTVQIERYSDSAFFWNSPVCRTPYVRARLATGHTARLFGHTASCGGAKRYQYAQLCSAVSSAAFQPHSRSSWPRWRTRQTMHPSDHIIHMRAKTHRIRTNTAVCMELHVRRDAVPAACALKLISWQDYAPSMIALRRERCADASAPAHCNIVVCAVWVQNG